MKLEDGISVLPADGGRYMVYGLRYVYGPSGTASRLLPDTWKTLDVGRWMFSVGRWTDVGLWALNTRHGEIS